MSSAGSSVSESMSVAATHGSKSDDEASKKSLIVHFKYISGRSAGEDFRIPNSDETITCGRLFGHLKKRYVDGWCLVTSKHGILCEYSGVRPLWTCAREIDGTTNQYEVTVLVAKRQLCEGARRTGALG